MNDNKENIYACCVHGATQLTMTKTVNGKYIVWREPVPSDDGESHMVTWIYQFDTCEEAQMLYEQLAGGKHE